MIPFKMLKKMLNLQLNENGNLPYQKLQEKRDKTVLAVDKVKDKKFPRSRIVDEADKLRVSSRQGNGFGTLLKVAEDYRTLDRASASDYRESSAQTAQFTSRCASVRGPR